MADVPAQPIMEVLGWKPAEDRTHVLVGLRQPDGTEIALALPETVLSEVILSLTQSMSAFPVPKGDHRALVMESNWYDIGQVEGSDQVYLRLRLATGGHLAFTMSRKMAEGLALSLSCSVGAAAVPVPSGTVRH